MMAVQTLKSQRKIQKSERLSSAVYRICAQKHCAGFLKNLAAAGVRCGRGDRCCNRAGAVSVLLGLLIAAVIYFGFRDDVYKKVYGPEHDRGQLPLPEGMSWEEAVDRIRRGFANPDVEQVTDTADAMTF